MNQLSISQLKASPQKAIQMAGDFPVEIKNRNTTQAYLIGKDIFQTMVSYLEDKVDRHAIENTDFSQGTSLTDLKKELGL